MPRPAPGGDGLGLDSAPLLQQDTSINVGTSAGFAAASGRPPCCICGSWSRSGRFVAAALLNCTLLALQLGLAYAGYREGPASKIPAKPLAYFSIPFFGAPMFLHLMGKYDMASFTNEDEAPAPVGRWRQCYQRWAIAGCGARLFGNVIADRTAEDEQIMARALPDATQTIHFFAFSTIWTAGWLYDIGLALQIFEGIMIQIAFLAGFWIIVQVRKAVAALHLDQQSLQNFCDKMLRFVLPAFAVELYLLWRFINWYGSIAEALAAAIDNGWLGPGSDAAAQFGASGDQDIVWGLWGLMLYVCAGSLWLGVASGLGVIGGGKAGGVDAIRTTLHWQLLLISGLLAPGRKR
jgi:hypothetical protein